MPSSEDIEAVKIAIETCNNPELKREVLCAPGSDYDISKSLFQITNKKQWNEIVDIKSAIILENQSLPKKLQEKVMGLVPLVGLRMLTWAEYHEGTLSFSRENSVEILRDSFFTSQGIIDNKKAAEALMNDSSLSITQRYKLACLYCFTEHIPVLYRQMANEDKEEFYDAENPERIKQPGLVKFWSYYLMGEIDKLREDKNISLYRLEKVIESGITMSVVYCLEKTNLRRKKNIVIDAAVDAVRNRTITRDDWIVFRYQRYDASRETWVPSNYYVDMLYFLLSEMTDNQKTEFLKKDIEGVLYKREPFQDRRRSRVLEYLLNWPYQDYFMKTAESMWGFLPERDYAVLLLKICVKIETKYATLEYGEERSYDYRELLKEFWCQSPERYKRYVFSNQEVGNIIVEAKAGVDLIMKLLTLSNFADEDGKSIKLILASATDKEKESITSSEELRHSCIELIMEEEWKILDRFVLNCFSSEEKADRFKWELSFTKEVQRICIDFLKKNKLDAAESFIKWSAASEEEINKLKVEMIYSEDGQRACIDLILQEGLKVANEFCEWYISSEEEFAKFKKELIFSDIGVGSCPTLVNQDKELIDEFTNWCLSSEEDINELKKIVAYKMGNYICEELISIHSEEDICDDMGYIIGRTMKFNGGQWEQVEKFLTWCFSSEKEICDFKNNALLPKSGAQIHFNLIKCNRFEEAETFFAWLGLSDEEIKDLKKETLFNHCKMFSELMFSEENDDDNYGDKKETIKLLLRWYLTDKEAVLEFHEKFKSKYSGEVTKERKVSLLEFDLMIAQHLEDLDEEYIAVKRKSDTFSPSKKLCNVEPESSENSS